MSVKRQYRHVAILHFRCPRGASTRFESYNLWRAPKFRSTDWGHLWLNNPMFLISGKADLSTPKLPLNTSPYPLFLHFLPYFPQQCTKGVSWRMCARAREPSHVTYIENLWLCHSIEWMRYMYCNYTSGSIFQPWRPLETSYNYHQP